MAKNMILSNERPYRMQGYKGKGKKNCLVGSRSHDNKPVGRVGTGEEMVE